MILLQKPWNPQTIFNDIDYVLEESLSKTLDSSGSLVLLPHSDGGPLNSALDEKEFVSLVSEITSKHDIFLAASAYIKNSNKSVQTIGYLISPDGKMLLRSFKIYPDLVEGFSDTQSNINDVSDFNVAMTKEGQVGLLCGEDILSPHFARSLVLSGAEIILNPSREWNDKNFEIRQMARQARSYENLAYVASASPIYLTKGDKKIYLPPATSFSELWGTKTCVKANESFLLSDVDIQALRERREEPMGNFPAVVRTQIYSPSYEKNRSSNKSPTSKSDWIDLGAQKVKTLYGSIKEHKDQINRYDVLLAQTVTHVSSGRNDLLSYREKNLDNALKVARQFSMSPSVKLVVFPEFFLTGAVSQLGANSSEIVDQIGISFPGKEADTIAKFAQDSKCFVAGGVFEYDPLWPKRFFNSAFIFDDNGELIHLYRKIHCADVFGRLPDTTPGSVFSEYLERYGYEHLYPVADTALGKLSTVICFDMNFGETHREMVRRGAEVIIHPTSEPHNIRRRGWDIARHVRAYENTAYILTAGHGGEFRNKELIDFPTHMNRGYSKIVNYDGSLQCVVDGPGAVPLVGSIDLTSLRRERKNIQNNLVIWDNPNVYADTYNLGRGIANDVWKDNPEENPYVNNIEINNNIKLYQREKIYIPSDKGNDREVADQSSNAVV